MPEKATSAPLEAGAPPISMRIPISVGSPTADVPLTLMNLSPLGVSPGTVTVVEKFPLSSTRA
jgi:hypothetical protein